MDNLPGSSHRREDEGPPTTRVLDRLEFGKLCTRRDAGIQDRTDHQLLARTQGFPDPLVRTCRPSRLGEGCEWLSKGQNPTYETRHATIVRPVAANTRVLPVACRVGLRSEAGDGIAGRMYWLGRFVVPSSGPLDPIGAHEGLGGPLAGLGPEDLALRAEALPAPRYPALEEGDRQFALGALEYLLSGVPIGISMPISESAFFRLAALVWWLLPEALRPLMGFAHNVIASSALWAFSASHKLPDTMAVYDRGTGVWRPPRRLGDGSPFRSSCTDPGRAYLAVAFAQDVRGRPNLTMRPPTIDNLSYTPPVSLAKYELGALISFEHHAAELFAAIGIACAEQLRLDGLRRRLDGPERVSAPPPTFVVDAFRNAAAEELVARFRATPSNPRIDAELIAFARSDPRAADAVLTSSRKQAGGYRAALLIGAMRQSRNLLSTLYAAHQAGEADDLPEETRLALEASFERADADGVETARVHAHLLLSRVEPFVRWARAHTTSVTLSVVKLDERVRDAALHALAVTCDGGATVSTFADVLALRTPKDESAAALGAMPESLLERIDHELIAAWIRAATRGDALQWLRLRSDVLPLDPVLRVARGDVLVFEDSAAALCAEISAREPPHALLRPLVLGVLRNRHAFSSSIREHPEAWESITDKFPSFLAWLMTGHDTAASSDQEIEDAAWSCSPTSAEVERAVRALDDTERSVDAAHFLWEGANRGWNTTGDSSAILRACGALARGDLPEDLSDDGMVDHVAHITRSAAAPRWLQSVRDGWWEQAPRTMVPVATIRLVLSVFLSDDLLPLSDHLTYLVPAPRWLARHCRDAGVNVQREERFALCFEPFQGVVFASDAGRKLWSNDYAETHLWAVFTGVPEGLQGNLGTALTAFGGSVERPGRRLRLVAEWLRAQHRSRVRLRDEDCRKVLSHVVIPVWLQAGATLEELRIVREHLDAPPRRSWPWQARWRAREIVYCHDRSNAPVVVESKRLFVDLTFRRLLALVTQQDGC